MDKVKIFDNFFDEEELNKIMDYFKSLDWHCQSHKSQGIFRKNDVPFWRIELEKIPYFAKELKHKIEEKLFQKECKLLRNYSVGQMYEQNSNYHTDSDEINQYTFCFYINTTFNIETNTDEKNGYFFLKIPNEKFILAIEPNINRGILFPSNYVHKGTGFNNIFNHLRICITWKYCIK
jgi:hypothetical protein